MTTALKTRKPTGAVPWPLILVEGGEKAGKSWMCAELSASDKVGTTYWIDIAEGSADEYGAIPGARYEIVEHDGSFGSIYRVVAAVHQEATRAAAAKEPPVVLVIDSGTAEWDLLKEWVGGRAKGSKSNQAKLRQDPDAEISIPMNLWNDANSRHRKLMNLLMTFPGICVVTARGKEVAAIDGGGRPIEGSKEYKVEGQKGLGFDATVWMRVSREHPPMVIGARSVHAGIRPGVDKPRPVPDLTLERLVFDVLRCVPAHAHVRDLVVPAAGADDLLPGESRPGDDDQVNDVQMKHMHALFNKVDLTDRELRLQYTIEVIGRQISSGKELTFGEANRVITALKKFEAQSCPPSERELIEAELNRLADNVAARYEEAA